ncbi:MAG: hypothetical protein WBB67_11870 [bacterium]
MNGVQQWLKRILILCDITEGFIKQCYHLIEMKNIQKKLLEEHFEDELLTAIAMGLCGTIIYFTLDKLGCPIINNSYLSLTSIFIGAIPPGILLEKRRAKNDLKRADESLICGDYKSAEFFVKEALRYGSKKVKEEAHITLESIYAIAGHEKASAE